MKPGQYIVAIGEFRAARCTRVPEAATEVGMTCRVVCDSRSWFLCNRRSLLFRTLLLESKLLPGQFDSLFSIRQTILQALALPLLLLLIGATGVSSMFGYVRQLWLAAQTGHSGGLFDSPMWWVLGFAVCMLFSAIAIYEIHLRKRLLLEFPRKVAEEEDTRAFPHGQCGSMQSIPLH